MQQRLPSHNALGLGGLALALIVAGCGGGGSGAPDAAVKPAAESSNASEVQRVRRLAAPVNPASWVEVPAVSDPLLQNLNIPAEAPTRGMWSGVQSWPMNGLHAALLPNGKVLTYGTTLDGNAQNGRYFDVWDPTLGFTPASHKTTFRAGQQDSFCAAATYLTDGRMLISGGNGSVTSSLYSTASDSVTQLNANMADQRWYATMLTLPDGRPLILGGMVPYAEGMQDNPNLSVSQGLASMTPEVYENGAWRSLFGAFSRDAFGPDYLRASYPRAWVMPGGRVFGVSAERMWSINPAGNGAITVHGAFKTAPNATTKPNVGATNSAVMFDIGKVLIVGGNGSFNGDGQPASKLATVIDFNSGAPVLSEQPSMVTERRYPNTIVLPDGKVLVSGGTRVGNSNGANSVFTTEIWNPNSGTWSTGASAAIFRGYHSFTILLPNGTVLSTGGGTPGPVTNLNAEVYYPPQLFRTVNNTAQLAPRPVMTAISGLSYANGATLQIDMAAEAPISRLALVGVSNGTHSFNAGQRRIPLTFIQESIRLSTTLPAADIAPPGYYQVVAIDAAGVPSRGAIIALGQGVSAPPGPTTPYNPPDLSAAIAAPMIAAGGTASYSLTPAAGATYSWDFGDGTAATAFSSVASITHVFAQAGLYNVTLTARATDGSVSRRSFVQAVAGPATERSPTASSSMALEPRAAAAARLWVANPDTDTVAVIDTASNARVAEITVGRSPRSIAVAPNGRIWVVNKGSATISIIDPATLAVTQTVSLPRASQPHGLAFAPGGGAAFVALEASGSVLKLDPTSGAQTGTVGVGIHARHVSVTADASTVLVSRFITPPMPGESTATVDTSAAGGEVVVVNPATMTTTRTIVLRHSDKTDTEIQGAGLPNYLGAAVISPDGRSAWVPSKQDNLKRGTLRNGQPLDFQNTVRAISSRIDMTTLAEDLPRRIDHDNSSVGSAAAFHPSGAYLFVALETSRQVAVVNAFGGSELFRIDVGRAPQGVAVSADGRRLYVQNFMDRSVTVIDLTPLVTRGELAAALQTTVSAITNERLPARVLLGKQLFYDARDPRLARDSYMSCASCHADGGHDGRTWDLTGFGEGLRNTIALKGRASLGHGFLHWSANFDELQDFEGQIRNLAGGTGLMSNTDFNAGTRNQPLGTTKTGVSADLDALAAYVESLGSFDPSPLRNADGSLTATAIAGRTVFQNAGCASCHNGASFTISGDASALKNIGTLKPASGTRLGGALGGIDVPTLRDVWATAPYLHDGSAPTLTAAVQAHQGNTVIGADLANLVAYLQQIGNDEAGPNSSLLSQGRATTQSSTDAGGLPGRAVDGNTSGVYSNSSVTHTLSEAQPWWQVDLGQVATLGQVTLWNRTDCCIDRLQNFTVFASANNMTGRTYAQLMADPTVASRTMATLGAAASRTLPLPPVQARYVRVQLAGTGILSLAEVQVFGAVATGSGTPTPTSPPANALSCAAENQTCTLPPGGSGTVWYGANAAWVTRSGVVGSIACNNATFGDPVPGTPKSCRYVLTSAGNLAPSASLNASYTSPWETLGAINNGIAPTSSADKNGGAYGNWNGVANHGATNWVSFSWPAARTLSAFEVYWWNDGAGIGTPTSATVEYWSGSAWVPIGSAGLALNAFNRVTFAPISTTSLRVSMRSATATGILEARVFGL